MFRPFDRDHPIAVKIVGPSHVVKFLWRGEPVEVGMRERKPPAILLDEDKCGARDVLPIGAESRGESTDEGRLARAEFPSQRQYRSRDDTGCQPFADTGRLTR